MELEIYLIIIEFDNISKSNRKQLDQILKEYIDNSEY